jgi:hypothetical protein
MSLVLSLTIIAQASVWAATTTTISSDGPSNGLSAYTLITNKLGSGAIEAPDSCHSGTHITETTSSPVGNAFRFILHRDSDCDPTGTTSGNQRNEIKVYSGSSDSLKGFKGNNMTYSYSWKFRVDSTMKISSRFTHIFQLKSEGGDSSHPVLTFTGANGNFEIRHSASSTDTVLKSIPWSDVQGTWIQATVNATMNDSGALSITLKRISDGKTLISYSGTKDMWRNGNFIRPKWGIYRSLADKAQLNDAIVYFEDWTITKN